MFTNQPISVRSNTSQSLLPGYYVNAFPDKCPWCNRGTDPVFLHGYLNMVANAMTLCFYCTYTDCKSHFIAYYIPGADRHHYILNNTEIGKPVKTIFEDSIKNISPDFIKIFNQAELAEDHSLDQIAGPGYRKALEFLIKDYIISKDPNLRSGVEGKLLGNCIKEYIDYPELRTMAKRAAWLGNDETHYVRKWENKDITDLKELITLAVHWIALKEITRDIIVEMPDALSAVSS